MSSISYDSSRQALYTPELRETLFEQGRNYRPLQIAIEAARLAYVRFDESAANHERLARDLSRIGFDPPEHFVDVLTDSQGFGAYRPGDRTALIAFRGTQPDKVTDIATDLDAFTVDWPESGGRVHHGFAHRARCLVPMVRQWLDQRCRERTSLIMTGHSLGAALATLVASILRPTLLATVGSPRVGNEDFKRVFGSLECVRVVDCCDAVTELPPELPAYVHICPPLYITKDGVSIPNPDAGAIRLDRVEGRAEYTLKYAWKIGSVLVRDLADHAPINYVRAFFD